MIPTTSQFKIKFSFQKLYFSNIVIWNYFIILKENIHTCARNLQSFNMISNQILKLPKQNSSQTMVCKSLWRKNGNDVLLLVFSPHFFFCKWRLMICKQIIKVIAGWVIASHRVASHFQFNVALTWHWGFPSFIANKRRTTSQEMAS